MLDLIDFDVLQELEKEVDRRKNNKNLLKSNRFKAKDIYEWLKHYFDSKFQLPFCNSVHGYFYDIRDDRFTSTLAPRGVAKTTFRCFAIPMYIALELNSGYKHYLNVQSTAKKAIDVNLSIRLEFETNDKLIKDYDYLVTSERWTQKQFVLKNGIIFSSAGSGESLRGINYRNVRPDYIIADDLYDDDERHNLERIIKKNDWINSTLLPCASRDKKHCYHFQGTAINESDILHISKKKRSRVYKKFKAIDDKGDTIWPENPAFTKESLMLIKSDIGSIAFEREYQNQCRDDETSIIKSAWVKYYDVLPYDRIGLFDFMNENKDLLGIHIFWNGFKGVIQDITINDRILILDIGNNFGKKECRLFIDGKTVKINNLRRFTNPNTTIKLSPSDEHVIYIIGACDPSIGKTDKSDFTSTAIVYVTNKNNYYVEHLSNDRISMDKRTLLMSELHKKYKCDRFRIEAIGAFADFANHVRLNTNVPIQEINSVKDKISRLEVQSIKFENGKVFFNNKIKKEILEESVHQLINNHPNHDDIRDAIVLALEHEFYNGQSVF